MPIIMVVLFCLEFEETKVPLHLIVKLLTDFVLILLGTSVKHFQLSHFNYLHCIEVLAVVISSTLPTFYTPDIELYLVEVVHLTN